MGLNEKQKIVTDGKNTFFTNNKFMIDSSIPTEGTFNKGDIIVNNGGNADKEPMWICVEAGTPGVWESVGTDEVDMDMLSEDVKQAIQNAGNIDLSGYATKEDLKNVEVDLSPYQEKTDEKLQTTDKTITGAINEVDNEFIVIKESLVNTLVTNGIECTMNDDWSVLFGLLLNNSNIGGGEEETPDTELITGQWNTLRAIGTGRSTMGVCAYEGKIYCIGGLTGSKTATNVVNRYDPSTDTWETLTPLPSGMFGVSCVAMNDAIHVFSKMITPDSNASEFCHYYYDITENTWGQENNQTSNSKIMPCCAFYDDVTNRVHMLVYNDDNLLGLKVYTALNGFDYIYDTDNNSPVLYLGSANCYHNGRIYSIGGYVGEETSLIMYKSLNVLDTASMSLMTLADFPVEIVGACAEVYNGYIYVFGGVCRDVNVSTSITLNKDLYIYDIANDSWTKLEGQGCTPRTYAGSCIIDNKIYAIGGNENTYLPSVSNVKTTNEVFVLEVEHEPMPI